MPTIDQTIQNLEDKRAKLVERGVRLVEERRLIAYDAHAEATRKPAPGSTSSMPKPRRTPANYKASTTPSHRQQEASRRAARAGTAADREQAAELRKQFDRFVALAEQADGALARFVSTCHEMKQTMDTIHQFGSASPTSMQLLTYGALATDSLLMQLPWAREYRHLSPRERRSFSALAKSWAAGAAPHIEARLAREEEAA